MESGLCECTHRDMVPYVYTHGSVCGIRFSVYTHACNGSLHVYKCLSNWGHLCANLYIHSHVVPYVHMHLFLWNWTHICLSFPSHNWEHDTVSHCGYALSYLSSNDSQQIVIFTVWMPFLLLFMPWLKYITERTIRIQTYTVMVLEVRLFWSNYW